MKKAFLLWHKGSHNIIAGGSGGEGSNNKMNTMEKLAYSFYFIAALFPLILSLHYFIIDTAWEEVFEVPYR